MVKNGRVSDILQGVLRSYSQIFFSESFWFAIPLVLVSFLDISSGFCGLLAVLTSNLSASVLKFDKLSTVKGYYGFNSLLAGLGLGYHFELTVIILVIAVFAGFLTLLITIAFQGILGKYYLPYLSMPFVFSIWIILSAGGMLNGAEYNQSGVYVLNELFLIGGNPLVNLHQWWVGNITSSFLNSYFLSLGAIFFQFNVFAGIVVAVSLLFYSRIAFLLSLLGYSVAYLAYFSLGMDMTQLGYSYIGFNFILCAIAIGGYFYIPTKQSFFWAFAITPVIALTAAGLSGLLKPFNLALLSLPFNIILLTFMYSFRFRSFTGKFNEVLIQEGTPERNLYSYRSFTSRFPNYGWLQINLPFYGEWYISQGHNEDLTHKGEWSDAWDFVIVDSDSKQYSSDGNDLNDYYCYGQNIIAPADGSVVAAEDGIKDNLIGEVNTVKNWGNTVIIKHAEGLYSKLSHLKNGSILVKVGDNVHYGQPIGKAGSSGRSPYPHLHFQIQATPYIGSKTLKYPLYSYIENRKEIGTFSYPAKGNRISHVEENPLLKKAFNLMPGMKLNWDIKTSKGADTASWEIFINTYNKSYIFCQVTKSRAYFRYDGVYFCFTHFEGEHNSLLYCFYLAAFKLPLVNINGYISVDHLPANQVFKGWRLFLHDITAPFFMYLRSNFEVKIIENGPDIDPDSYDFYSEITGYSFNREVLNEKFILTITRSNSIRLECKSLNIKAICESY